MLECLLSVKPDRGGEKKMVSKQLEDDLYLLGYCVAEESIYKGHCALCIVHCALCIVHCALQCCRGLYNELYADLSAVSLRGYIRVNSRFSITTKHCQVAQCLDW